MPTELGDHTSAGGVAGLCTGIFFLILINALFVAAEVALSSAPADADDGKPHPTTAIRIVTVFATMALGVITGPIWFAAIAVALVHIVVGVLVPGVLGAERPQTIRRYILLLFERSLKSYHL